MKLLRTISISFLTFISMACGDNADALYAAMKSREIKFSFEKAPNDEFWNYMDFNLNEIARGQVAWDARKHDSNVQLMVIRGIKDDFTLNGVMSVSEALNKALVYYECIAILDVEKVIVVPNSIKLDMKKYEMVEARIYKNR